MFTIPPLKSALIFALISIFLGTPPKISAQTLDGKFDVGGRHIRIACQGSGSPTVVIDAGLGTAPIEDAAWQNVSFKTSVTTRVCMYDRAGLGGSEPNPKPFITSLDSVSDLHRALEVAGVHGPYLIAGQSIGGLHALVFANRYPSDVAGLVLVSSTCPDQFSTWLKLLPPPANGEAKAISDTRSFLEAILSGSSKNSEHLDVRRSTEQALQLHSLGSKTVIVLTHSPRFRMVPGLEEPLSIKLENATQQMQKEFLKLSTNSKQHIAATAGHHLQLEDPDFVISGIAEGVRDVRASRGF